MDITKLKTKPIAWDIETIATPTGFQKWKFITGSEQTAKNKAGLDTRTNKAVLISFAIYDDDKIIAGVCDLTKDFVYKYEDGNLKQVNIKVINVINAILNNNFWIGANLKFDILSLIKDYPQIIDRLKDKNLIIYDVLTQIKILYPLFFRFDNNFRKNNNIYEFLKLSNLKFYAEKFLNIKLDKEIRQSGFHKITQNHLIYSVKDAITTLQLAYEVTKKLKIILNEYKQLKNYLFETRLRSALIELNINLDKDLLILPIQYLEAEFDKYLCLIENEGLILNENIDEIIVKLREQYINSEREARNIVRNIGIKYGFRIENASTYSKEYIILFTYLCKKANINLKQTDKGNVELDKDFIKQLAKKEAKTEIEQDIKLLAQARQKVYEIRNNYSLADKYKKMQTASKFFESQLKLFSRFRNYATPTGRLAAYDPNVMQIPRLIKKNFYSKKITSVDFAGIELRIMAVLAQDSDMLEKFNNGADLHRYLASLVFNKPEDEIDKETERQIAKKMNFGLIYGMSHLTLQEEIIKDVGINITENEAKKFKNSFFNTWRGVARYHKTQKYYFYSEMNKFRFCVVYTIGKRPIMVLELNKAYNAPDQGTGADLLKLSVIKLFRTNPDVKIINLIHDEIVGYKEYEEEIKQAMAWAGKKLLKELNTVLD